MGFFPRSSRTQAPALFLTEGSSCVVFCAPFKLPGMTMRHFSRLETAYFKQHKQRLLVDGIRPAVPSLSNERLISLLTVSRSIHTEAAETTLLQRSVIFLLMGGFLDPAMTTVGLNVLYVSANRVPEDADVLLGMEDELLSSLMISPKPTWQRQGRLKLSCGK